MGKYLVVSRVETLREHMALSREYAVGFEINDFFDPELLENPERQQEIDTTGSDFRRGVLCTVHFWM